MTATIIKPKVIECSSEELEKLMEVITGVSQDEEDCYECEGDYEVMIESGKALGRFIARVIENHYQMADDPEGICKLSRGFSDLCDITDSESATDLILSVLRGFHMYPVALYLEELMDCNDEQFADCFICTLNNCITDYIEGAELYG